MTLREYLAAEDIKVGEFAKAIGVDRVSVSRYLGGGKPSSTVMERIRVATKNKVTPNDFFEPALKAS